MTLTQSARSDEPRKSAAVQALLVLNPNARQVAAHLSDTVTSLEDAGVHLIAPPSFDITEIAALLRGVDSPPDVVIVAGGDGTLNGAIQALIDARLPVGIMPLGTANDLAKTLGIPTELPAAAKVIAEGHRRRIDVGQVNGHYFFLEASVGLSVNISRGMTKELKQRFGPFAIVINALRVATRMRRFHATVECDGESFHTATAQLTIGNGKNFGGFVTSHDADITDAQLDLYNLDFKHWWDIVGMFIALVRGRSKAILMMQGKRFTVQTRRTRSIEADGEIVSKTPAEIKVVPRAVEVCVPAPR